MEKLKIGILTNDTFISAWEYEILRQIADSSYAEIVLVIKRNAEGIPFKRRIKSRKKYILFGLISKLEAKLLKKALKPNAFERKNLLTLLPKVSIVDVKPKETLYCEQINKNDIDKIRSFNIDVIIRMGFKILKGDILKVSKYGIWSFHHGNNLVNRGGPPGFWEVALKWPESGFILQTLTEDLDGGIVLERVNVATNISFPIINYNMLLWKSVNVIPRKLKQLYEVGGEAFFKIVNNKDYKNNFYQNKLFRAPTNFQAISLYIKILLRFSFKVIKKLIWEDQWFLIYTTHKEGKQPKDLYKYKKIIPPLDRFWADPFVIEKDNKYFIFFEELIYKKNQGHISFLSLDEKGDTSEVKPIIETDYHLSFPFIFSYNNEFYMIPESCSRKTIELYKCQSFPDKWVFVKVLMKDINATDNCLLLKDGRWWLFTSLASDFVEDYNFQLFAFYSKSDDLLNTEWIPHKLNPLVTDVKKARMAGSFFMKEGKLYRPTQDCSVRYGYGIRINEIVTLNENEFSEKMANEVYPFWSKNINGIHTFNTDDNITVLDAVRRVVKFKTR